MSKVVIIGAGIAGISSAIRLRIVGHEVDVFEQNEYAGGKLSEIHMDGFRFDAGPSLFTMPQHVEELFSKAKKNIHQYFAYTKKSNVCNYFFSDGQEFSANAERTTLVKEMSAAFDTSASQIEKYLNNSKSKYDLTAQLFLEKSLHKTKTYLNRQTLKAILHLPSLHLNKTLDGVNKSYFKNKNLIQFFNRYATYNGSSPFQTPGIMSLIPHLEQYFGTYFPKGGMISITKSLVKLAEDIGVRFHYNSNIEKIELEQMKAVGIRTQYKFIPADIVISNMDIVPTYKLLLKETKAPKRTLSQERSSSALIFYWGIKGIFPKLDLHNIFFSADYNTEFDDIFNKQTISPDSTIYLNISSKEEPNDAPQGCENWFILVNAPSNTGQDWDELIRKTRAHVVKKLSKHLKQDIESFILCEEILDPRKIEQKTRSYQGALYGSSSNSKFAAFLRHPNFSRQFKNLYFCGGSVHPGGGIPLCLLSGKITSELVIKDHAVN